MSFSPSVPTLISASNVFVVGNTASGNALSVQQVGAGNVATFRTTTGATALFINPSGYVGVGTTNPGDILHVYGGPARIDNGASGDSGLAFYNNTNFRGRVAYSFVGGYMYYQNDTQDKMRFYNGASGVVNLQPSGSGAVAFSYAGTPSYDSTIFVQSRSNTIPNIISYTAGGGTASGGTKSINRFHSDSTYQLNINNTTFSGAVLSATSFPYGGPENSGYVLRVGTASGDDTSFTPYLMVKASNGYVGIGTASPQSTLQVQVGDVVPTASGNMATGLIISQSSVGPALCLGSRTTGGNYNWIHSAYTNNSGISAPLSLQPIGGSVGIGTTNPGALLDVWGNFRVYSNNNGAPNSIQVYNQSSGSSAYSIVSVKSDSAGDLSMFKNSTTRTGDGGANTATIRNDLGDIRIQGGAAADTGIRVTNAGNVGIGTASPQSILDVYTVGTSTIGNSGGQIAINAATGYSVLFTVNGVNQAYVGTAALTAAADNALNLGGGTAQRWKTVYAVNGTIQTSDSRYKDSVPLQYGLNEVLKANTILYSWKTQASLPDTDPEKNFKYFGVCADELVNVMPELCYNENPDVAVNINYSELVPVCINAIKELSVKVTSLEARLEQMQSALAVQGPSVPS